MNKFVPVALFATFAVLGLAPNAVFAKETSQTVRSATQEAGVELSTGTMLYGPDGRRIGAIYRVNAQGNAQLILNSKLVTVPASTISNVGGKATTSLTKSQITK